jgi:hypothetical protein
LNKFSTSIKKNSFLYGVSKMEKGDTDFWSTLPLSLSHPHLSTYPDTIVSLDCGLLRVGYNTGDLAGRQLPVEKSVWVEETV